MMRILLVEDEPRVAQMLAKGLRGAGVFAVEDSGISFGGGGL